MSYQQIPNLPVAIALNGTEQLEAVQAGSSVKVSINQITANVDANIQPIVDAAIAEIDLAVTIGEATIDNAVVDAEAVLQVYVDDAATSASEADVSAAEAAASAASLGYLVGSQAIRTVAATETWNSGREQYGSLDHTTADWDFWNPLSTAEQVQLFSQDPSQSRIHLSWSTTNAGFAESGTLTEIALHTGFFDSNSNIVMPTTTGAKVQMWIVRPTAPLPTTTGTSVTFTKVHAIGERDLPNSQTDVRDSVVFSGLNFPVLAGDVPAYRVINAGIRFGVNAGGRTDYNNTISTLINDTDLSISTSLSTSKTGTTLRPGRSFFNQATIVKSDYYAAGNTPRGRLMLDEEGNIPVNIIRKADNYWKGAKVAILGSSISTYSGGGTGATVGHIPMLMDALQCNPYYFSIGGGYGLWPPTAITGAAQFIAGTEAEFVARYGAGGDPGQYSYERRILGQGFDAVLFPDLINDSNSGATVGTRGTTDRWTVWGAFQRMGEAILLDNPNCMIFQQGPAHRWANYVTPGTVPTEQANRIQFTDAMIDIADWYGWPTVIDFIRRGGIGASRVQNGTGLIDNIHPAQTNGPKPQMAGYARGIFVAHGKK